MEINIYRTNVTDLEKIVVTDESSADASFFNISNDNLVVESVEATEGEYTFDNEGRTTLNYTTELSDSNPTSKATFEFLKAEDVTINVEDRVNVEGAVILKAAERCRFKCSFRR